MNYKKHYDALMQKAASRAKPEGYVEVHHVVPRSMGGTDDESNLVALTAREHFMAHAMLAKFVNQEPHASKMKFAFFAMCNQRRDYQYRYRAKSKIYEMARVLHAESMSRLHSGKILSEDQYERLRNGSIKYFSVKENRDAHSEAFKNRWKDPVFRNYMIKRQNESRTPEYIQSISDGLKRHYNSESGEKHKKVVSELSKARWSDDSYRERMLNATKSYWEDMTPEEYEAVCKKMSESFSEESRKRISEKSKANAKEVHKKVECEHCKAKISRQNYTRFHGDKCSKLTGKSHKHTVVYCPHCNKKCSPSTLSRWHGDNCKHADGLVKLA